MENGQREDIHPMEECIGFERILENEEYKALQDPVQTLAEKIGKSKSYVYQRLKLKDLTEEARTEFLAGQFSSGHAILIARLTPKDQYDAITYLCFDTEWKNVAGVNGHYRGARYDQGKSVRDLARWITNQKGSDLTKVAWCRDSLTLLPQAGSCAQCEKRENDLCLDKACFEKKQNAHVQASVEILRTTKAEPVLVSERWGTDMKGVVPSEKYRLAKEDDPGAIPAVRVQSAQNSDKPLGEILYIIPKAETKEEKSQWQIDAEEEARRKKLEAKIELHARTEAIKYIADAIPEVWGTNDNHLLRAMAMRFVVGNTEKAMDETLLSLGCEQWKEEYYNGSRNAIKETLRTPTVQRFLDSLTGLPLVRTFFRIAAVNELKINEYSCPDPIMLNVFADVTLVDIDFLRREARDKFTPAAKKSKAPKVVPVQTSAIETPKEDPEQTKSNAVAKQETVGADA